MTQLKYDQVASTLNQDYSGYGRLAIDAYKNMGDSLRDVGNSFSDMYTEFKNNKFLNDLAAARDPNNVQSINEFLRQAGASDKYLGMSSAVRQQAMQDQGNMYNQLNAENLDINKRKLDALQSRADRARANGDIRALRAANAELEREMTEKGIRSDAAIWHDVPALEDVYAGTNLKNAQADQARANAWKTRYDVTAANDEDILFTLGYQNIEANPNLIEAITRGNMNVVAEIVANKFYEVTGRRPSPQAVRRFMENFRQHPNDPIALGTRGGWGNLNEHLTSDMLNTSEMDWNSTNKQYTSLGTVAQSSYSRGATTDVNEPANTSTQNKSTANGGEGASNNPVSQGGGDSAIADTLTKESDVQQENEFGSFLGSLPDDASVAGSFADAAKAIEAAGSDTGLLNSGRNLYGSPRQQADLPNRRSSSSSPVTGGVNAAIDAESQLQSALQNNAKQTESRAALPTGQSITGAQLDRDALTQSFGNAVNEINQQKQVAAIDDMLTTATQAPALAQGQSDQNDSILSRIDNALFPAANAAELSIRGNPNVQLPEEAQGEPAVGDYSQESLAQTSNKELEDARYNALQRIWEGIKDRPLDVQLQYLSGAVKNGFMTPKEAKAMINGEIQPPVDQNAEDQRKINDVVGNAGGPRADLRDTAAANTNIPYASEEYNEALSTFVADAINAVANLGSTEDGITDESRIIAAKDSADNLIGAMAVDFHKKSFGEETLVSGVNGYAAYQIALASKKADVNTHLARLPLKINDKDLTVDDINMLVSAITGEGENGSLNSLQKVINGLAMVDNEGELNFQLSRSNQVELFRAAATLGNKFQGPYKYVVGLYCALNGLEQRAAISLMSWSHGDIKFNAEKAEKSAERIEQAVRRPKSQMGEYAKRVTATVNGLNKFYTSYNNWEKASASIRQYADLGKPGTANENTRRANALLIQEQINNSQKDVINSLNTLQKSMINTIPTADQQQIYKMMGIQ